MNLSNRQERIKWKVLLDGTFPYTDENIRQVMKRTCTPILNAKEAIRLRDLGQLKP
jgi:hypothetical protein